MSGVRSVVTLPLAAGDSESLDGVGAAVLSVKMSDAVPVRLIALVSLAIKVWAPSASPVGVNTQLPALLVIVWPSVFGPSLIMTIAFGSAVPATVGFEVMPSIGDTPVSKASPSVRNGVSVSRVSTSVLLVPVLPARSVARAVRLGTASLANVMARLQAPPLAVVVPIGFPLSSSVIVGFAGRFAGSATVPVIA